MKTNITVLNGKFLVHADPAHKEVCKMIPFRKFKGGRWECPLTQKNIDYLQRTFPKDMFSDRALKAMETYGGWEVDTSGYKFKTKPYKCQEEAFNFSASKKFVALFMEMGCGKTKVIIDEANFQFGEGRIDAVLVLCPNSVKSSWQEEIPKHGMVDSLVHVYDSSKKKKATKHTEAEHDGIKWMIAAIESLSQGTGKQYLEDFVHNHNTAVIVDESSYIKNHNAARTESIVDLGHAAVYRRILSGTPIAKGVEDLYAQFYFLDPSIINFPSYFAFRNNHCIMGGYKAKQIIGYMRMDDLFERLRLCTYRATKAENLDLPDKIYEKRTLEMTKEQKKVYTEMKKNLMAELAEGKVEATTALTKTLRLHQIAGGFLSIDQEDGTWKSTAIPGRNPKLEELLNILGGTDASVIVWCKYTAEIRAIETALQIAGISCVTAYGAIPDAIRTENRQKFQAGEAKVFIAQIESMGIGITLTAATLVVYYSNSYAYTARVQSEDRAHRIGQKNNVTYVDLVVKDSIDQAIIVALQKKQSVADMVMDSVSMEHFMDGGVS